MTDIKKIIDGLEHCRRGPIGCQLHCPYSPDHSCKKNLLDDTLGLIYRLNNVIVCGDKALQALEDMETNIPCDMMATCDWCEENCNNDGYAKKECWVRYLMEGNDGTDGG